MLVQFKDIFRALCSCPHWCLPCFKCYPVKSRPWRSETAKNYSSKQ